MRLHFQRLAAFSGALAIMTFVGCAGPSGVRVTEGQRREVAPVITHSTPIIVHIDLFARIATIRNGIALNDEFLITTNYAGAETAVLKARPSSLSETLLTADILEGEPQVNNAVKTAGAARSTELAKVYRNIDEEN